jgi:tetratricopeptide (TPR) repeat protein
MRLLKTMLVTLTALLVADVDADYKSQNLGYGWRAMTEQSDPFDTSKFKIRQIYKDIFTVQCNQISWLTASDVLFDSFSFPAEIKYMVDKGSSVDKIGSKSTYLGGSDMVNNDRYFSFTFDETDLTSFSKGKVLNLAGRISASGWETRTLDLSGFEVAYNQMCDVETENREASTHEIQQDYKSATNKILLDGDIEAAKIALNLHLDKYPNSPFAADSYYWLGEIYLLNGEAELARDMFTVITEQYFNHPKVMDSNFKLGKIYFELGYLEKARMLIELVAGSSAQVAREARSFLNKNFK